MILGRIRPGGQLIQATDEYMATRNARVVLVDGEKVRAVPAWDSSSSSSP
ncbi:MAG: hypothetical protein P8Y25_15710 [Chromatiaceae bacterium]